MWKNAKSIYEFTLKTLSHPQKDISLSEYKGKVILITNVASKWGRTNVNYEQLNILQDKYREKGLVVLGIPTNTFGWQEPEAGEPLACSISQKFKPNFQIFDKKSTANEEEVFLYLQNLKMGKGLIGTKIRFSWTKFLIDRKGELVMRYGVNENPETFENDIVKLLEEPVE